MIEALVDTKHLDRLTQISDIFNGIVSNGIEKLREAALLVQGILPELYGGISALLDIADQ